jgi:hypothetical protein
MTKISKDRGYRDLNKDPVVLRDGTVLTEELALEWAIEIEHRLKPSRGSIDRSADVVSGVSARSVLVSARVPPTLFDKLHDRSQAEGKPMSEVIREALQAYLS